MAKKSGTYDCEFGGVSPGRTHRKLAVTITAADEATRIGLEDILLGAKLSVTLSGQDTLFGRAKELVLDAECDGVNVRPTKVSFKLRVHREAVTAEHFEQLMYVDGKIGLKRVGDADPPKRGRPAGGDGDDDGDEDDKD